MLELLLFLSLLRLGDEKIVVSLCNCKQLFTAGTRYKDGGVVREKAGELEVFHVMSSVPS